MVLTFRTLRLKSGLTCKEIASIVGVKETTLKKYECSVRIPSNLKLIKLEKALGCSKNDFMEAYTHHKEINLYRTKLKEKLKEDVK